MTSNDNIYSISVRFPQSTMEEIEFLLQKHPNSNRSELIRRIIHREYKLLQSMGPEDELIIRKPNGKETKIIFL